MQPTRRELLKTGLGGLAVLSLGSTIPRFLGQFAFAEVPVSGALSNDNILVVVQLSGGNDGLNTVIPFTDDAYGKGRPVIAIRDRFHKLNDELALNPGLKPFKSLFDDGKLAVINGCGYPNPNRSHFRSMEIWHTANPKDPQPTGWLGHYLDHALRGTDNPVKAVNIGAELPQALIATGAPVPSIQSINDFAVRTDPATPQDAALERRIIKDLSAVRSESPALEFLSRQATNAIVSTEQIRRVSARYRSDVNYPPRGLGPQLRLIAQIINGGFGTRLFYCQTGGFDTHSNQVGGHEQLLSSLAGAIAAFEADLASKGMGNKVAVMCFSEFGRRVAQNGSNGTDHGAAGPMFVIGGKVKGGIYGTHPSLTDLDRGDLKFTVDFRRVYGTLLDRWLNADSAKVLSGRFEALEFL